MIDDDWIHSCYHGAVSVFTLSGEAGWRPNILKIQPIFLNALKNGFLHISKAHHYDNQSW